MPPVARSLIIVGPRRVAWPPTAELFRADDCDDRRFGIGNWRRVFSPSHFLYVVYVVYAERVNWRRGRGRGRGKGATEAKERGGTWRSVLFIR